MGKKEEQKQKRMRILLEIASSINNKSFVQFPSMEYDGKLIMETEECVYTIRDAGPNSHDLAS